MMTTVSAIPAATPATTPAHRTSLRRVTRSAVQLALAVAAGLGGTALAAGAQGRPTPAAGFELRPYAGAFIPTGDQRDLLEDAVVVGGQAAYRIRPQFAITGTFGWSPSTDRITAGSETIDVFQYDVGAEARAPSWFASGAWDFTPFVGLGVGARTYNYRDLDVDAKTNAAGYGALGGEFGFKRVGFRVEARDYLSRFEPLTGDGDAETRNDVTLAAGLTLRF